MTERRAHNWLAIATLASLLLAGCAGQPSPPHSESCWSGKVLLDVYFEGGQMGYCNPRGDGHFELTLYPEDPPPINDSPWYALRVSGETGTAVTIDMTVEDGQARYWPKASTDRMTWQRLPQEAVSFSESGDQMVVEWKLPGPVSFLSAQELLTSTWLEDWIGDLGVLPHMRTTVAGKSAQGRPIFMTKSPDRDEVVLMVGRQHPPEITGSVAMRPFVETVLGDSALAREFRERFQVVIFPFLNPDGVALGHWRHNTGGVDLNRDWGPFTQPETQIVKRWLDNFDQTDAQLRLMMDFHSTNRNLVYTQSDGELTDPPGFANRWLIEVANRLPDYEFTHEPTEFSEQKNSKNYFYSTYGIPGITHETGDETPRDEVREAAVIFAEEMMKLMLSYPPPG